MLDTRSPTDLGRLLQPWAWIRRAYDLTTGVRRELVHETARRVDMLPRDNLTEAGYDRFGYSPEFAKKVLPGFALLYRYYFRVISHGLHHVPDRGRVMLVGNHSGQLPFDGAMVGMSLLLDRTPPRLARAMVDHVLPSVPFAGLFMARSGQVVGTPDNCEALLGDEECILVFPEGSEGISKTYARRYQLQRFGYGFMRLAIRTRTPIVPFAVVGAEEQSISLYNWRGAARILGMPAMPITPRFPWLGPAGLWPLPVRYRIYYGAPLRFEGDPGDDDGVVGRKVRVVKTAIGALIDHGLAHRPGAFR